MSEKEAIVSALSRLFDKVDREISACVAEEFLISVRQNGWDSEAIVDAMTEYLQQDVRSSGEIYTRQKLLEGEFSNASKVQIINSWQQNVIHRGLTYLHQILIRFHDRLNIQTQQKKSTFSLRQSTLVGHIPKLGFEA